MWIFLIVLALFTGVATQSAWLSRGLDVDSKAVRLANYVVTLRKEMLWLSHACGHPHPTFVSSEQLDIIDDRLRARSLREHFNYDRDWGLPSSEDQDAIRKLMERPLGARGDCGALA